MNDTPCPLCNHLRRKCLTAFIKREYRELERCENELEKHRSSCDIVNGAWYLGLWQNAQLTPPRLGQRNQKGETA